MKMNRGTKHTILPCRLVAILEHLHADGASTDAIILVFERGETEVAEE